DIARCRSLADTSPFAAAAAVRVPGMTENAVGLILSRMPKDMRKPAVAMIADLRKAAEEVRDQIDCC
ncbi:MAG: hypothetical protein WBN09_14895, partial [Woeseiaceae bacterium]